MRLPRVGPISGSGGEEGVPTGPAPAPSPSQVGTIPDVWGSTEPQCVSSRCVSRPTLIFDDVESLSSETEEEAVPCG